MIKSFIYGLLGAATAVIILFVGYTAYQDHQLVKALVQIEQQRQAQQK